MAKRLLHLEALVRRLQVMVTGLSLALLIGVAAAFRQAASDDQVLRVRGLVIVDSAGRERILIGAPLPEAKSRLRTDLARVDSAWSGRFPRGAYMKYYGTYRNAMSGMLVLDEHGIDRVAIGDSLPDPNIGRRIGSDVGMLVNDRNGFERSDYGLLSVNGRDRMVLGLDSDQGREAVTLAVFDSGRAGVRIDGRGFAGFLGAAPSEDRIGGVAEPFAGLFMKQGSAIKRVTPTRPQRDTTPGVVTVLNLGGYTSARAASRDSLLDQLASARARWSRQQKPRLRFRVQMLCFCLASPPLPLYAMVEIAGDSVVSVIDQNGRPTRTIHPTTGRPSVTWLFAYAEEVIRGDADEVTIAFDPVLGIPTRIRVDPRVFVTDDELDVIVSHLAVGPDAVRAP